MTTKIELTQKLRKLMHREALLIRQNKKQMVTKVRIEIEEVNAALFGIRIWRFDKYREREKENTVSSEGV